MSNEHSKELFFDKLATFLAEKEKWPRKSEQADKWRICYL